MTVDDECGAIVDCAHYVEGRRIPGVVPLAEAGDLARSDDGFVWIGLKTPNDADIAEVAAEFELPALAVEDAVQAHQRPKVEVYDNVLFAVIKPVSYRDKQMTVSEIALFIGDGFVVAVRHGDSDVLRNVRRRVDAGGDPLRHGPYSVLYRVMDEVVDEYEVVIEDLRSDTDEIEADVFGVHEIDHAQPIYELKRRVATLRRSVMPLVLPVKRIVEGDIGRVPADLVHPFRDVFDHLLRATESLESQDRMLSDVLQADLARAGVRQAEISLRQNEDMRKMSAWAAIGLLPTAIGGVYGMNFQNMPELRWRYSYYVVVGIMALGCYTLYRQFRRRGWL